MNDSFKKIGEALRRAEERGLERLMWRVNFVFRLII